MSINEAKNYVDLVMETLNEWGVITDDAFGKFSENRREELAEKIQQRGEE